MASCFQSLWCQDAILYSCLWAFASIFKNASIFGFGSLLPLYCTSPSLLNFASISSICFPIFSGSQSKLAQMIRSPSGVRVLPCSWSVRYCWYFSYSLFDICFIVPSGHLGKLEFVQSLQIMLRLRNRPSVPMSTYNPTCPRASGPCLNP